jgi:hypothetical protein
MQLTLYPIEREALAMRRALRVIERNQMITLHTVNSPITVQPETIVYLNYESCTARTMRGGETGRIWDGEACVQVLLPPIDTGKPLA